MYEYDLNHSNLDDVLMQTSLQDLKLIKQTASMKDESLLHVGYK